MWPFYKNVSKSTWQPLWYNIQYLLCDMIKIHKKRCKQSFEISRQCYLPHSKVVQPIRAVEDHTLHGQGFGQILGGLSLSCPCWALRGSAKAQVEGSYLRQRRGMWTTQSEKIRHSVREIKTF